MIYGNISVDMYLFLISILTSRRRPLNIIYLYDYRYDTLTEERNHQQAGKQKQPTATIPAPNLHSYGNNI